LRRVSDERPRYVREVNPEVPEWLAAIIARLHAKAPAARYQSAAEVAGVLGEQLARLQQPGGLAASTSLRAGRGRARRWAVAAGLLVAVAAGIGATDAAGVTHVWELLSTVIRIPYGQGTLVIEVDDPAVKVQLEGEDVVIAGTGVHELRLKPGQYQLQALRDGKAVKTELVTVSRGDRRVVRVSLEGAPRVASRPAEPPPAERILLNPGFEEDAAGQPAYWVAMPKTSNLEPAAMCKRDTETAAEGEASALVFKPAVYDPSAQAGFLQAITKIPARGHTIRLSVKIKTKGVAGAAYVSVAYPLGGRRVVPSSRKTAEVTGTTDWSTYTLSIPILEQPNPGDHLHVSLVLRGAGYAWFDDLRTTVEETPLAAEGGTAPSAPPGTSPPSGTNLLANGGFDVVAEGKPVGWEAGAVQAPGLVLELDRLVRRSGPYSATIRCTATGPLPPYGWRQEVTENLSVGKTLSLTGWVKTEKADNASVAVRLLDENTELISFYTTQHTQDFKGTGEWRQFTLRFPVPGGTRKLAVIAMLLGQGQVWFDDLSLVADEGQP
jgi:hypothetical protein